MKPHNKQIKINNLSLKWKLFFLIFSFVLIIVFVFVIFQIGLFGHFYETNKIKRSRDLISDVAELLTGQNLDHNLDNELSNALEKISLDEESAIYVYAKLPDEIAGIDGNVNEYQTLIYKTISGGSFSILDTSLVAEIWDKAETTPYQKFYVVISANPIQMFETQILNIDTKVADLRKALPQQVNSVMSCSFIKLADGQKYLLILDNKIIPVESAVSTLKLQLIYIIIIIMVLTIIIVLLLSKAIVKPITKMSNTARLMTQGSYDVVFDAGGFLEVNELNTTLNNMIKELQKTETLRRELMANVSHDLRTPLTMILGYAEMMKDLPGENNPENLQIVIDEVNRLNLLVNDMLDLSKLTSKTIELHPQFYSLTDNLQEIVDRYQKFHQNDGFNFKLYFNQNVNIIADETKIDQVIYNFLNNAINYSGKSRLIEIKQEVENNDFVKVMIIDHGVGIKAEDLANIWDRYFRIDKGLRRSVQGSGLGLAIVKEILEIHHFEYGVESKLNIGSTFWFKMPIAKE